MNSSEWCRAVENKASTLSARLQVLSYRSGDHSAGGKWFRVYWLIDCPDMLLITNWLAEPSGFVCCNLRTGWHLCQSDFSLNAMIGLG